MLTIIEEFNGLVGGIEWRDRDRINQTVTVDIPAAVAKDAKFENARQNSDRENARVESDNPDFRRWLADTAFRLAYKRRAEERDALPRRCGGVCPPHWRRPPVARTPSDTS